MDTTWELYEMFQAFLKAPSYHLALEAFLMVWVLWLIFHKSYKPERLELTEKEKEELIAEWKPEPLVPDSSKNHYALKPRVVSGALGKKITVNGTECLNMGTHNYLGLIDSPEIKEAAVKGLRKYGVGSCGPRGFYGTVDVHLDLEAQLAEFMGVEEAILYSYGFSCMPSAIPAYAKRGDVIFCDEGVSFPIQKGLSASRSQIVFFKHNNVEDLERLLLEQDDLDKKNPKKAKVTRRFLVIEGLYMNYGDVCPLIELLELKKRFKVRLFIDESCSFGVLGKNGRGVTEHFNIPVEDVDLISACLDYAIGSYGGFCCGSSYVVDHQRLSGLGYCFSASLPPLQSIVASVAIDVLKSKPELVEKLQKNARFAHKELQRLTKLLVCGDEVSPVKHLRLAADRAEAQQLLEQIVDHMQEEGVALTVARYIDEEEHLVPPPSIRLIVSAILDEEEISSVVSLLEKNSDTLL
ncbi:serine palmitoyltransferase 1-like [Limulus polyphemus]|uniref:Serine palmitoyltransferase 1 n=1 Tax=Limulus polyphemus TaxID=6850 RepID=A0ABM1B1B7_LIMPO|nr:serine palmitoyltransferase 1-like [Limulus polyphemus]XP_013772767.1 serine palmitoyltransferase 1-like [Limulus polyphemus]